MERINREIKLSIRKYVLMHKGTVWKDWVPEILCGLRMVAARSHGYTPFFVAYKQLPLLPGRPMLVDPRMPLSWDSICADERDYTTELCSLYASIRASLRDRLVETGEA